MSEEIKKENAPVQAPVDPAAAPAEGEVVEKAKKSGQSIPAGIAFIRSTFNNTQVSIADARGGVISWSSAGKAGFKGSRKSTAFAATMVAQDAARVAVAKGMHECEAIGKYLSAHFPWITKDLEKKPIVLPEAAN